MKSDTRNAGVNRLAQGGAIDRSRLLHFHFDGRRYAGHPGDTLASALLANGVVLFGRSFKLHRPRGVLSAGPEEPNALVQLEQGTWTEPNTRATMVALYDGLRASSQNRWPSLRLDAQAVTGALAPLIPAGFYYKTFKWPASAWHWYETLIRRAAGLGRAPASSDPDPDRYAHRHLDCDVLVVGAGPAGLAAALAALEADPGAGIVVVDERDYFGGSAHGAAQRDWCDTALARLRASGTVRLLARTTLFGYYDHNTLGALERLAHPVTAGAPRQRLWHLHAGRVVLATGAIEQPLLFGNNDLPGIMLASAALAYLQRYAVAVGRRVLVVGDNDDLVATARQFHAAGVAVAAVVDCRPHGAVTERAGAALAQAGIAYFPAAQVLAARGWQRVAALTIRAADGRRQTIACDALLMAGGWSPVVHLWSQSGGTLRHDAAIGAFVPAASKQPVVAAGAARGVFDFEAAVRDGELAGRLAPDATMPPAPAAAPRILYTPADGGAPCFVDFQADVTRADIELALRENYRSVEHLKRYTTLGMGTDQGKTSNLNGLTLLAAGRAQAIAEVGTTTFRPPYTPVTIGSFAGAAIGRAYAPQRQSPLYAWHAANGALFAQLGWWQRAAAFPLPGESGEAASRREARHVRQYVGLADVSTLGKIEVQGPDAAVFLDRVYSNNLQTLIVGKLRYGLMLREDGIVFDDGVAARLGSEHYLLSTTTAGAAKVLSHLEWLLAAVWPALRVRVCDVTDRVAQCALAGPHSAAVLATLLPSLADGVAPASVTQIDWRGHLLTLFQLSFSGEAAYELAIRAEHGIELWQALLAAGAPFGIAPYGADAVAMLRIEAGHVAGPELDGRTTPGDLGLAQLANKPRDFIGRRLLQRPALQDPARAALVGLLARDPARPLRAGAALVGAGALRSNLGWISSATYSPRLRRWVALAFVEGGRARLGQSLVACSPLHDEQVAVEVVAPGFLDLPHDESATNGSAGRLYAEAVPIPLARGGAYRVAETGQPFSLTLAAPAVINQVAAFRAADAAPVQHALRQHFSLPEVVLPNRVVVAGDVEIVANGPGSWLLLGQAGDGGLAQPLRQPLQAHAAVTDVGGALVGLLLQGPGAREVLESACAMDLSARHLRPGDARTVSVHGVAVLLTWQGGDAFRLLVRRSVAASLHGWLLHASVGKQADKDGNQDSNQFAARPDVSTT